MVNEPKNIDEFFKQSLTNYEIPTKRNEWESIKTKVAIKSFFKFNPYTLNIYYLVPVITAALASFLLFDDSTIEGFSELEEKVEFISAKPTEFTETYIVPAETIKEINTTSYSQGQVIIEREEVIQMEMTVEAIELTYQQELKDSYIQTITTIDSAPAELVFEEDDIEMLSTDDTVPLEKEKIFKKKKSRKKSRPLKMH